MQISKINNINFGYNKKINDKYQSLVKRDLNLEHAEKATLLGTISSSMKLEDRIVKLEGTGYSQIADNQKSINMLASLLIQQKTFLCYWADRLYPDMNYPQIECSEYNCQIPEIETKEMPEGLKNAYFWRKDLIKQVAQEVPNLDISDENINDFEKGAIIVNSEDKSSVIEPFVPHSFSPKSLDDVVGLKSQIQDIKDLIVLPLTNPEEAQNLKDNWGVDIPHFILFYGPPGCGKTMSAEAIKAQTDCTMYKFDISKLGSKWVNESSKNIAKAFGEIEKIANNSKKPVLVFMDELDSMLSRRGGTDSGGKEDNKVVNTLLQYIVRAKDNNIIIIGATNRYDALDGAVKDRVEQRAYMGLPDDDERKELILRHITKYKMCLDLARCDEDITFITKLLRPYSPRSIIAILKAASKEAYRDNKRPLCAGDVVLAIKKGNFEEINEAEYIPKKQKHSIGFCDTK